MFKVGDKVKIPYISDCNPHNNKVGVITWLHDYNYYPNRDYSVIQKKTQGTITYDDGTTEAVGDFYREGSGLVSEIVAVKDNSIVTEKGMERRVTPREFVRHSLADALRKGITGVQQFDYQYSTPDGRMFSISGTIFKKGKQYLSDFRIERTNADGHKCSAVPVFGMPLTQKAIANIAEIAVEAL